MSHPKPYVDRFSEERGARVGILSLAFLLLYFLFVTYAYLYAFDEHGGPKPLYYYMVFIGLSTLVGVFHIFSPSFPRGASLTAFNAWFLIFVIYSASHVILSPHPEHALNGLIAIWQAGLLAICAIYVLLIYRLIEAAMLVMFVASILAIAMNIWDFIDPNFSTVSGRAAGLYGNPTISGQVISLMMVASLPVLHARFRMLFVLACGVGILLTFSRAAWIFWLIGLYSLWSWYDIPRQGIYYARAALALLVTMILGILLFSGALGDILAGSAIESYLTPNTKARLGIGAEVMSGDSYNDRGTLISFSLKNFMEAPILGHGLGYTDAMSYRPHNMYFLFLVEGGIIGLSIYLLFLFILWKWASGVGKPMVSILVVSGLFTHNNLEQPAMMLITGFIVAHGVWSTRREPARAGAGAKD